MKKEIWFDMDGTIADLYGVENWLPMLRAEDTTPYLVAAPLLNLAVLARLLNKAQRNGYKLGVISWTAKGGSYEYNEMVAEAKKKWLAIHLKSVHFDAVDIVEYGTPKEEGRYGILFDDEEKNRQNWNEVAFDQTQILEILRQL